MVCNILLIFLPLTAATLLFNVNNNVQNLKTQIIEKSKEIQKIESQLKETKKIIIT